MIDWTHPPKRKKTNKPQDTNNQLYWQEAFCCCCWVWTGLHANIRWAVIKSIYYFVCVEPWPVVTYCSNILSFELSLLTRMDFRQLAKDHLVSNSKSFLRLEKASLNQPKHKRTNLAETNEDNKKVQYYSKMTHARNQLLFCFVFYRSSGTAGRRHSVPLKRCQVHPGAVNQPVCR